MSHATEQRSMTSTETTFECCYQHAENIKLPLNSFFFGYTHNEVNLPYVMPGTRGEEHIKQGK